MACRDHSMVYVCLFGGRMSYVVYSTSMTYFIGQFTNCPDNATITSFVFSHNLSLNLTTFQQFSSARCNFLNLCLSSQKLKWPWCSVSLRVPREFAGLGAKLHLGHYDLTPRRWEYTFHKFDGLGGRASPSPLGSPEYCLKTSLVQQLFNFVWSQNTSSQYGSYHITSH